MTATVKRASWRERLALIPGYDCFKTARPTDRFDESLADRAVDFFPECLVHIEGRFANEPFHLEAWQQAVNGCLFGWLDKDGNRRYREVFFYVPRGNGKTPWAGGTAIYGLNCDNERGAQIYLAAAAADQAAIAFRYVRGMVEAEPMLSARCRVFKGTGQRAIVLRSDETASIKVLSSDAETKHGFVPHIVIADELHAWQSRELMDVFQTAFSKRARRQPILISITTADFMRNSICNEKYEYACKVRDGVIHDPTFLPVIYEAKPEDDWTSPETWRKANPNYGVTVDEEGIRRECERAKQTPAYEFEFKRLHLNIRTQQRFKGIDLAKWDKAKPRRELATLAKEPCYAAIDLSAVRDVTAMSVVFRDGEAHDVFTWYWIPQETLAQRQSTEQVPWVEWVRQGKAFATAGGQVDYLRVKADMIRILKDLCVQKVGIDPYNSTYIVSELEAAGFKVELYRQNWQSISAPTKAFDAAVAEGNIRHGGDPILKWMASNVAYKVDESDNWRPDKGKSTDRIDGIVATIMGVGLWMASPIEKGSIYDSGERDGFLMI